jgi:integrase
MVTFWRSYWNYLEGIEAVPAGSKPFSLIRPPTAAKKTGQGGWVPFRPDDVHSLVRAAQQRGDTELTDLIVLGAYTGARIEELCALKVEHLRQTYFRIVDSKTEAGVREVPIHAELRPVVERLKAASSDGYLLSGLTFNKYDDRSNAIGKRFGRLKTALGHGPKHVFHSLRKTLVTMLEDAGVSENLAADIVGHEKPRITYGLYSGGASLATKADALARVQYEGLSVQ